MHLRFAAVVLFGAGALGADRRSIRAFQGESDWPEEVLLADAASLGICISGGGSRSYTAAMGALRSLHDLDILQRARYLSGVSGGAWATGAYTFSQLNVSDEVLLGPALQPENLTLDNLKVMDDLSARAAPTRRFRSILVEEVAKATVNWHYPINQAYERALSRVFLEPLNIPRDALFTWSASTLEELLERNPQLQSSLQWVRPQNRRPFPILGTAILGPFEFNPQPAENHSWSGCEITPLYVGVPHIANVTYTNDRSSESGTLLLGSLVEPIGYGSGGPDAGLAPGLKADVLSVAEPSREYPLARALSQSSLAPAAVLSQDLPSGAKIAADRVAYWSPASPHPISTDMDVADGGDLENLGIMPLLRRRVERIILMANTLTPLASREQWDPSERLPTNAEMADDVAALFGVIVDANDTQSWDYKKNQVFDRSEFESLCIALQDGVAKGTGAVTTMKLTTVANDWWGIPAGVTSTITFVYLSRVQAWEELLPDEVRQLLPVENTFDPSDPDEDDSNGVSFPNFPHYSTGLVYLTPERTNLLAALTTAMIQYNAVEFADILAKEGEVSV